MRNNKALFVILLIIVILTVFLVMNFHKIKFALSLIYLASNKGIIKHNSENSSWETNISNPLQALLESTDVVDDTRDIEDENIEDSISYKNVNNNNISDNKVNNLNHISDTQGIKNPTRSDSKPKKLYVEIIKEYNEKLENLKAEFEAELDALIDQGIKEYSQGKLSNTELANKYLSLGADLEKNCDKKFYNLLDVMKKELRANGYHTTIVDEVKNYYVSYKNTRKTEIIDRGMKYLE